MIRSLFIGCLMILLIGLAFFEGAGRSVVWHTKPFFRSLPPIGGIDPWREVPCGEAKPFVVVLYAHNAASWCERVLLSIFEQDYESYRILFIDDGSEDDTFERAQRFIVANQQERRVIAIRNERLVGYLGSLYRAADACSDREILVPIEGKNWFAHDGVLSKLNQIFQNPDVWIAFGRSLQYPSYQAISFHLPQKGEEWTKVSDLFAPALAFYAGLFKSIRLSDLMVEGGFSEIEFCYLIFLLEQSGGRFRSLDEVMLFVNGSGGIRERSKSPIGEDFLRAHVPYSPLCQFPSPSGEQKSSVDVVLFSSGNPLQLYATLESACRYISGYRNITAFYTVNHPRFAASYESIKRTFPGVCYVALESVSEEFKPQLLHAVFDSSADYVLFGGEDFLVKDFTDLDLCRRMAEKTGAFAFHLHLGRHIRAPFLPGIPLNNGIYAWDLQRGEGDFSAEKRRLDKVVYRKRDLKEVLSRRDYTSLETLAEDWAKQGPPSRLGLYFERSCVVSLSSAAVGSEKIEEPFATFNRGLKIDIDPLFQVENASPRCEEAVEFITR